MEEEMFGAALTSDWYTVLHDTTNLPPTIFILLTWPKTEAAVGVII